jgi:hypothetical protein
VRKPFSVCLLAAVGLAACGSAENPPDSAASEGPSEWAPLFDGADLSRWNAVGDANWRIVSDYVEADQGTGFLVSDRDYADFELTLEFWVTLEANSGVFVRCQDRSEIGADNCYEVNIFDTRPDPTYRTGSIVNVAAPAAVVNTGGRWNAFHIVAQGPRLQVTLNGVPTVDIEDAQFATGPIGLQYGAGTVIFRNVRIRTL